MAALRNDNETYGLVARVLHWGMAIAIIALFAMGIWMRGLSYYDPMYQTAPDIHRSVGMILFALLVLRLIWKLINKTPSDAHLTRFERLASRLTHWGFYGLLFALMIAGYLISTTDGRAIAVFGLVEIPSLYKDPTITETAGILHEYLAYAVIALAGLHALAALKHHFVDKDTILLRMLNGKKTRS